MLKFYQALYMLTTGMIVVGPAWYNRYPLMYFDSGAYMEMAVNFEPSFHRAIGYPLLIKFTGFLVSNWPLVLLQGVVVSYLIYQYLRLFAPRAQRYAWHFVTVVLLSFFSSVSWYASQLMPDVWTLIHVLSLGLILIDRRASWMKMVVYSLITYLGLLTHLSHIPMLLLLLLTLLLLRLDRRFAAIIKRKALGIWAGLLILSFITVSSFNALNGMGFRMSLASNAFIAANLGEMGILKFYLDEQCPERDLILCEWKDKLPKETYGYLWDPNGPVQQHPEGWAGANAAMAPIVHDFITKPRYLKWLVFASVKSTIQQMAQIELGSGLQYAYGEGTPPYWPMKEHFKQELNEYLTSVQNKGDALPLAFFRWMNYISLMLSILILGRAVIYRHLSPQLALLLLFFFAAYFFNAAITGVLANVYERLQCRLLPLIQFLAILVYLVGRKDQKHATEED
jgi:hypothetical protein